MTTLNSQTKITKSIIQKMTISNLEFLYICSARENTDFYMP